MESHFNDHATYMRDPDYTKFLEAFVLYGIVKNFDFWNILRLCARATAAGKKYYLEVNALAFEYTPGALRAPARLRVRTF